MLLATVKTKALSFLSQPSEQVKNHYLRCSLCLVGKRKRLRMTSSNGSIIVALKREKMRALCSPWEDSGLSVWILSSKTKKCDLWRASGEVWLWSFFGESRRRRRRRRELERVWSWKMKMRVCCVGGEATTYTRLKGEDIFWFCAN